MKVCWRNTANGRSTILDFDETLHKVFNQQRRAEALIYGIVQVVGERIAQSETYDSIEIWVTYPYICTFTVFCHGDGEQQPQPAVKVEFEVRANIGLGPGYVTEVTNLRTGQVFEDKVVVAQLAWEIVHSVMTFLFQLVPGIDQTFRKLYGDSLSKVSSELDPELWTIKNRHPQFSTAAI